MSEVQFDVPSSILDSLPSEDDGAVADMEQAVAGWEQRINQGIEAADSTQEIGEVLVDSIDIMESRLERYDAFVPELRAWGQSPIHAIAWRNLYAHLIQQIADNDQYADLIDRERNARLVEDGIRWENIE
ncbi:hypothetical protein K0C01_07220 [Salinarchaeum sp. IM2453]|uniref:hypothetical protein n=1 Tax=Salinarchaeum sp. IM2453 TaxID=2862870 RepID=UPI001C83F0CF|nr:hypothetical protein [Salinarchaeum sp. IM2453]QZA87601.1 hypothetical protein K0C01_07220 [Salinarchaeum sp. IM2453]